MLLQFKQKHKPFPVGVEALPPLVELLRFFLAGTTGGVAGTPFAADRVRLRPSTSGPRSFVIASLSSRALSMVDTRADFDFFPLPGVSFCKNAYDRLHFRTVTTGEEECFMKGKRYYVVKQVLVANSNSANKGKYDNRLYINTHIR